jgi:thioredoxin reductase (NADPH)
MLEIKGDTKVRSVILEQTEPATGTIKRYEEETDAVFIFVGSTPQTHLVPEAKKDEGGYIITDQRMESSIPGLFVAGDVRATPFRQVVVAAAEGAIAAHCASQYIDILKGESYQ